MQTKLTLRLDDELIREVKIIADRRGQPVSKIVANYFNSLKREIEIEQTSTNPDCQIFKRGIKGFYP